MTSAYKAFCLLIAIFCSLTLPLSSFAETKEKASQPMDENALNYLWQRTLSGKHRAQANKQRDVYRNPRATLEFFEVTPEMHVAEIWPGGKGWYTEILAPYLSAHGQLYAAQFHPAARIKYYRSSFQSFIEKIGQHPDIYINMRVTTLQPPKHIEIAPPASLDRVLTFRNVHNWIKSGKEDQVFQAMYRALKPGGILGVVEHRGKPGIPRSQMMTTGYVPEDFVIAMAKKAGFIFVAKSEINANAKDSTNHPKGVWTLPPSLRLGEESRDKYLKIGESDRMTLKFKKP